MAAAPQTFEYNETLTAGYPPDFPELEPSSLFDLSHSIAVGGLGTARRQFPLYALLLHHEASPLPAADRYFPPLDRGRSPFEEMTGHLEEQLVEVTERVGGPVSFVGHSLGVHLGSVVTMRRPELVKSFLSIGGIPRGIHSLTPVGHGLKQLLKHAAGVEDIMSDSDYMQAHAEDLATKWPAHVPMHLMATPLDELATFRDTLDIQLPPGQVAEKTVITANAPGVKWLLRKTMGMPDDAEIVHSLVPAFHEFMPWHPSVIGYDRAVRRVASDQAANLMVEAWSMSRPTLVPAPA